MKQFEAQLSILSIHYVGTKARAEELILSRAEVPLIEPIEEELLWNYFIDNIDTDQNFRFGSSQILNLIQDIFSEEMSFHSKGKEIAMLLFDAGSSSNIKAGELFIAYFKNMMFEDEVVDAIGIFKSETKDRFLKLKNLEDSISIMSEDGININKLDKGCLIYNTEKNDGYRVKIHKGNSQSVSTKYWIDTFLGLEAISDNFQHTNHYLKLTKDFVTKKLPEQADVTKTDQIDYLNRSINYFSGNENFDSENFTSEIFESPETQSSFNEFKSLYQEKKNIAIPEDFGISQNAVDKNKRVFRSVLKLDKNFHVYIHGDKSLIERGQESNGRKYYKIYFNEES